ncbi:restriction endonuclease subunit S [Fibrobacter sp. UWB3]|uniref:restriction endonuclease subunit S n=1 Tax=Fibrobacter sp. UWB3 TaxID=1964357 RepID=UPI000B520315|nr:restriction endonuclease subunit S [Fibrobacter sp. UWB3]OWV16736.1 hypothetical protein B7991_13335 [Fibrobacter sp. UWB3]
MDGKQLKNSILQWAIQGKLVPQNPKDEPAQKLLERLAASRNAGDSRHSERSEESSKGSKKTSLRGAKATKQSKNPTSRIYRENGVWYEQVGTATPKDISDEIPFEIPETWAWCRLGNLIKISSGDGLVSKDMKKGDIPVFGGNGITGYHTEANVFEETVVIGRVGFYCGSVHVTPNKAWVTDNAFITDYPKSEINREFLVFCLKFLDLGKSHNATAQPVVSGKKIYPLFFPLPPLAEQKRIVAKLEQVLPLAEEYGAAQEQLDKLNKELPEALKKSILQEAIQGKLVPQNPKDEPASVLLAKIRKEKESLVKQGKLKKKDLNCDSIAEEDLPFELPSNWEWCRLEDIVWLLSDGTHKTPKYTESGIPFVSVKNMSSGRLSFENTKFVSKEESDILNQRCNPEKGDLLLSKVGTTGIPVIVDVDFQFSLFVSLALIKFFPNLIDSSFFVYLIKSPLVQNQVREHTRGVGNKNWVLNDIAKTIIAIPPLAEQKRIVTKLEQLFKVL